MVFFFPLQTVSEGESNPKEENGEGCISVHSHTHTYNIQTHRSYIFICITCFGNEVHFRECSARSHIPLQVWVGLLLSSLTSWDKWPKAVGQEPRLEGSHLMVRYLKTDVMVSCDSLGLQSKSHRVSEAIRLVALRRSKPGCWGCVEASSWVSFGFKRIYRAWVDFPSGSVVKNLPAMQETQETWARYLGQEDSLKYGMATHLRWPRGKESSCKAGNLGSIPGSGRYPAEGNDNPLQNPFLGNPMDRGTWGIMTQGGHKSQTRLCN